MKFYSKILTLSALVALSTASFSSEYAGESITGSLCGIKHTPDSGGILWSIHRFDFDSQSSEQVFGVSKNRKIQSVACRTPTEPVLFSMKETQGGDYEIYEYDPARAEPLKQITRNDTDDVDVTVSADGKTVAYQQRLDDGRQALSITYSDDSYQYPTKTLASATPFVQPTLSANGRWLVFVQLRSSYFALMRYDILQNKYTEIRKVPRRKRLHHPSISDDGNTIGWSENRNQNRYLIKDVSTGTVTQVVNNTDGIEHGVLSSDGKMLIYSVNNDNGLQVFITNLSTLETALISEPESLPSRYLGAMWQGGVDKSEANAENALFSLVKSSLKPKTTLFPDQSRITLTFDQEVDVDSIEGSIFITKVSTGEVFSVGVNDPWGGEDTYRVSWSQPAEYIGTEPGLINCGFFGNEGCVTNKKVINLNLSPISFDNGNYTLSVTSDLATLSSGTSLKSDTEIPFNIIKPQNFYVEAKGISVGKAENIAEINFRVYNNNSATKVLYKTELSSGQVREGSFEMGPYTGSGGPGTVYGGAICTLYAGVRETGRRYVENEVNYQTLKAFINNGTNHPFNGNISINFCTEEGECKTFNFDMNVAADPNFSPESTLPNCLALLE